ncbi:MAG: FAD-binding oxidoreductase [Enterobacteriaceae bacterium]
MNLWVTGEIIQVINWTKRLFSIIIKASVNKFIAGQFAKLKIKINGKNIQRAYSYVNSPKEKYLEFYIVSVDKGIFSNALKKLKVNDLIKISKQPSGYFTLCNINPCNKLWMISTGTAIGPYLSILSHGKNLNKFKNIILIYAVRFAKDLSFLPRLIYLQKKYKNKLFIRFIISREYLYHSMSGRITNLIKNGKLEKSLKMSINKKDSHVMLCGNPNMVRETKKILMKRGMIQNTKLKIGNITTEQYW